jgi:predicted ATPase
MLTRLEADGFKNLLGFECDFGPYTCIAGPNAAGKSNIFDAIEFLALLADHSFMEAAQLLRAVGPRSGDPKTLFWDAGSGATPRISLAAEMIVPNGIEDDFGREVVPTTTFLRYEVELEYHKPEEGSFSQLGRVVLVREDLKHITLGDAVSHLRWPHAKKKFRDEVVRGRRSGTAYISTTFDQGEGVVNVHQDGGSRGKPRTSPASRAPRTVVSTTTSSDDPTILAARREMQQWRMLALEPSAMRSPDSSSDPSRVAANGSHLAAALFSMASERGPDVYAEVASAASALTDVREIDVDLDIHRELLTLEARLGNGPMLPARSLSDGSLRFLALCIIGADDQTRGLLCMEEPENGIHPARIEAMVNLVRDLAVDPTEPPGSGNSFRQVMVNTHSPYYVQYQAPADLLLAMPTTINRAGVASTTVSLLPLAGTWRAAGAPAVVSKATIMDYLINPPGSQLSLDLVTESLS